MSAVACPLQVQPGRGSQLASHVAIVDCWIGTSQETDRRIVRVAGCLSAAQVPALLEACAEDSGALHVDLTDLVSVDVAGVDALQRLQAGGAALIGVPGFIQMKLQSSRPSLPPWPKGR